MFKYWKTNPIFWALTVLLFQVLIAIFTKLNTLFLSLLAIIFLMYYMRSLKKRKIDDIHVAPKNKFTRNILFQKVLDNAPMGIIIFDDTKKVIWENKYFNSEEWKLILKTFFDTEEKRTFVLNGDYFKTEDKIIKIPYISKKISVYFIKKETKTYELQAKMKDNRAVVLYIQVDNFDELVAICPEENRPEILAKIDKAVTRWVQDYNGFSKKYSNDKFIALMSFKDFKRAKDEKFSILNDVREIKASPSMAATLSIGVSYGDEKFSEINRTAQNALDLCLGRGGDQVVIKAEGDTEFFGGKTKEVERYSRVRARVFSHALKNLIKESDKVYLLGHVFLDMDALGASIGLLNGINDIGKSGYIILSEESSPSVESLMELLSRDEELSKSFITERQALEELSAKTLVIVVDTHKPSLCISQQVIEKANKVVVIDHHRRSEEFIDKAILVYMEPYASSTSEMVTEMLQYMGEDIKLNQKAATALLAGIAVDTKNFAFKTGVRTFEAASFLRRQGADPTTVYKLFQEDIETVNVRSSIINKAERIHENIAISYYDKKPKNPMLIAAQAANSLLEIKGIYASFVLVPYDEGITVSARSLGDINVQMILEKLGGGGHMTVAGAQIKDCDLKEAIQKVKKAVLEYIKEGELK